MTHIYRFEKQINSYCFCFVSIFENKEKQTNKDSLALIQLTKNAIKLIMTSADVQLDVEIVERAIEMRCNDSRRRRVHLRDRDALIGAQIEHGLVRVAVVAAVRRLRTDHRQLLVELREIVVVMSHRVEHGRHVADHDADSCHESRIRSMTWCEIIKHHIDHKLRCFCYFEL